MPLLDGSLYLRWLRYSDLVIAGKGESICLRKIASQKFSSFGVFVSLKL